MICFGPLMNTFFELSLEKCQDKTVPIGDTPVNVCVNMCKCLCKCVCKCVYVYICTCVCLKIGLQCTDFLFMFSQHKETLMNYLLSAVVPNIISSRTPKQKNLNWRTPGKLLVNTYLMYLLYFMIQALFVCTLILKLFLNLKKSILETLKKGYQ